MAHPAKVFETRAYYKAVVREGRLRPAVNDLQEEFAHSGVDGVAHKVSVERFQNGFAGEYFGGHSGGVGHTGAAYGFNQRFLNNAVFYVERKFARALLGSAPAHAVGKTFDILDFLCLNPLSFFGNGGGTVFEPAGHALGNTNHIFNVF